MDSEESTQTQVKARLEIHSKMEGVYVVQGYNLWVTVDESG